MSPVSCQLLTAVPTALLSQLLVQFPTEPGLPMDSQLLEQLDKSFSLAEPLLQLGQLEPSLLVPTYKRSVLVHLTWSLVVQQLLPSLLVLSLLLIWKQHKPSVVQRHSMTSPSLITT